MCCLVSRKVCPECGARRAQAGKASKRQKVAEELQEYPFYTGTGPKPAGINREAKSNAKKAAKDILASKEVCRSGCGEGGSRHGKSMSALVL